MIACGRMKRESTDPIPMKNTPILFILLLLALVSCQSKEEKADKLIKEEMYKTLYDFSSYEPIETIVDSAFTSIYQDTLILGYARLMDDYLEKASEYIEKTEASQSALEIGGGRYSGLSNYKKAMEEFNLNLDMAEENMNSYLEIQKLTKERAENFQRFFCGWQAKHKFRYKTKEGRFDLSNRLYVFDPDLKKITYQENTDDQEQIKLKEIIDEALK